MSPLVLVVLKLAMSQLVQIAEPNGWPISQLERKFRRRFKRKLKNGEQHSAKWCEILTGRDRMQPWVQCCWRWSCCRMGVMWRGGGGGK